MATMLLSGHSIPQLLANGKIGLTALADLTGVSRVTATSFIELAHTLTTPKEDDSDTSSEGQLLPLTEFRLTNPLNCDRFFVELQGDYVTQADVERIPTTPPFYAICYAVASLVLGLLSSVNDAELMRRQELLRNFQHGGNGTILQPMAIALLAISTLVSKAPTDLELVRKAKDYLKHFTLSKRPVLCARSDRA